MIGRAVRGILSGILVGFAILLSALPAVALESFARSSLTVETSGGGKYRFDVELAETPAQQAQGLMFRETMAADAGMLFTYNRPQPASFWMKNTLIPLDMIFIGSDGRIVNIHANAVPQSLDAVNSAGPVKGILEINGGMSARLGIRPGDRVVHPVFGTAK
ncbi:DUF192 domain-containing protein [Azospirillum formosense]|uniref:DUF192 domain-containing protein n=1 Tax=Azospirillum formosense TaxID=861533 RepID=A0ABX2KXX9_9PROT|nr:DUF192 domain-containing protein [Azospirillum formosense]MBY3753046.1 DUF192 domain-containing protein [Azospirillum formosense]NUB17775.1 DUF192 domain-containing protein [Azospirillum formosense]